MTFFELYEAWQRGELLLIDGAMARLYIRKNGNIRIQEIFSTKKGSGRHLINQIKDLAQTRGSIIKASCPSNLESVPFWPKVGFIETRRYFSAKGNEIVEFEWRPE